MGLLGYFNLTAQSRLLPFLLISIFLVFVLLLLFFKRISSFFEKNEKKILLVLIFLLFIFQLFFVFNIRLTMDDRFHLHSAYLIYLGQKPYADFFAHHMPSYYFFLSPVFNFFQDSINIIYIARIISLVFTCLILFFTYKIARLYYSEKIALYAVVLTFLFREFFSIAYTIRADAISAAFFLAAVYSLLYYHKYGKKTYIFFSAFLFSVSLIFLQKMIFSVVIFFLGILVLRKIGKKKILSEFLIFSLTTIALGIIFLGSLYLYLSKEGFIDFLKLVIFLNMEITSQGSLLHNIITMILINGFFLFLFFYSFVRERKKIAPQITLLILSLLPFLIIMLYKRMLGAQYFFYFIPAFSIPVSVAFNELKKWNKHIILFIFLFFMLAIPLAVFYIDLNRSSGLGEEIATIRDFQNMAANSVVLDKGYFIFHKNWEYFDFYVPHLEKLNKLNLGKEIDRDVLIEKLKPEFIRDSEGKGYPGYEPTGIFYIYKRANTTR